MGMEEWQGPELQDERELYTLFLDSIKQMGDGMDNTIERCLEKTKKIKK